MFNNNLQNSTHKTGEINQQMYARGRSTWVLINIKYIGTVNF